MDIKHESWGVIIKIPNIDIELHRNEDGDLVSLSLSTSEGNHTVDVSVIEDERGNPELWADGFYMGGR